MSRTSGRVCWLDQLEAPDRPERDDPAARATLPAQQAPAAQPTTDPNTTEPIATTPAAASPTVTAPTSGGTATPVTTAAPTPTATDTPATPVTTPAPTPPPPARRPLRQPTPTPPAAGTPTTPVTTPAPTPPATDTPPTGTDAEESDAHGPGHGHAGDNARAHTPAAGTPATPVTTPVPTPPAPARRPRGLSRRRVRRPTPTPLPVRPTHPLTGRGTGTFQATRANPDVGAEFKFQGTAQMAALGGPVAVAGDLKTPGNIADGVTTGTLTVSTKAGSVTVALTSFRPPVEVGAPIWYRYRGDRRDRDVRRPARHRVPPAGLGAGPRPGPADDRHPADPGHAGDRPGDDAGDHRPVVGRRLRPARRPVRGPPRRPPRRPRLR